MNDITHHQGIPARSVKREIPKTKLERGERASGKCKRTKPTDATTLITYECTQALYHVHVFTDLK